jgi:alpha(1,3/1,4) fucosyltransferase
MPVRGPIGKTRIRLNIARFWTGATPEEIVRILLCDLTPDFEFETSGSPQLLLYGPYGGAVPTGRFVKVFVGCENVRPIMSECDWAFGVEHEDRVHHPRYMRFMRWGDDSHLIQAERNWAEIVRSKTRFCAFIYSNRCVYREAFFRALSAYKRVDAPGLSMNNMAAIDPVPGRPDWKAKVEFLRQYKFVISFENGSRAGYNTEKLTHAIEADCLPIYWGDSEIGRSFNVGRLINAHDYLANPRQFVPRLHYAPHSVNSNGPPTLLARAARRLNGIAADTEQRMWALAGFRPLIERIIDVDRSVDLYLQHLREPFLIANRPADRSPWIARWREIFDQSLSR